MRSPRPHPFAPPRGAKQACAAGAPFNSVEKLRRFARLIKLEHTLFALPFSLGSLILAARGWPPWPVLGWVLLAIVAGRSFAMACNRVIDRHLDARNPRTRARELPSGLLSLREVLIFIAVTGVLLVWAVSH